MEATGNSNMMRARAEALVQKRFHTSDTLTAMSPEDTRQILHELRVHQIQLEMQNDELRNAQVALEQSRARYVDLYDFAPLGHCSIDASGVITEANLTLTTLLGVSRSALIGMPLARFVLSNDQDCFYLLTKRMLAEQVVNPQIAEPPHSIEMRMSSSDGNVFWVRLVAAHALSLGQQLLRIVISNISAHKQVEIELASSKRRLRAIIETEPDCVKVLDRDGRLLEMNAAGLRLIEADSFQQIENYSVFNFVDEAQRAARRALNERVFQGESGILEFQITGLKGTRRWAESHSSPLRDDNGTITAALSITRDVSARKSAEACLRLSDVALKSISQGVIIADAEQRIVSANAAFTAITGFSSNEILGRNCNFLQGPETDSKTLEAIRLALKSNTEFAGEILNYTKIGTAFWNELTISPVFDTQGMLSHYIAVTRDITARRLIERTNQETTMQLRFVIRGGDIGFWDWNTASDRLEVNDRWYTMLGLDADGSVPGIDLWYSLVHLDDMHKLTLLFDSVILNPQGVSGETEVRVRHQAGHYIWILDRFSVVERSNDGKPLRVVGTHLDITERKHAENEVQKQLHELQRWQEVMLGREGRVLSLKREVNELLAQHNQPPRYSSTEAQ